jgi:hypothetical protein
VDVAVAAVAVVAAVVAVAVAVAAPPGEPAAGARPTRDVIASMNRSCQGRARPSRPGQFLSFSCPAGFSGSRLRNPHSFFQLMFSHDFPDRFLRIDASALLRPLAASRLRQEMHW